MEVPDAIIQAAKLAALMSIIFLGALWFSLVLWTGRDIALRSTNPAERTAAVVTVGVLFLLGFVIYRMFRPAKTLQERYVLALEEEAILQGLEEIHACGECGKRNGEGFLYCPYCRAQLKELCASCHSAMEPAWAVCAYCGHDKAAPAPAVPAAAAAGG